MTSEKQKPKVYILKPGFDWNPLVRLRNYNCPCGSKKKAKRCHGRDVTLPKELASMLKGLMKAQGLD